jgi:hypothetical protein
MSKIRTYFIFLLSILGIFIVSTPHHVPIKPFMPKYLSQNNAMCISSIKENSSYQAIGKIYQKKESLKTTPPSSDQSTKTIPPHQQILGITIKTSALSSTYALINHPYHLDKMPLSTSSKPALPLTESPSKIYANEIPLPRTHQKILISQETYEHILNTLSLESQSQQITTTKVHHIERISKNQPLSNDAVNLVIKGTKPLNDKLNLFAKGGLVYIDDPSYTDTNNTAALNSRLLESLSNNTIATLNALHPTASIGTDYHLSENISTNLTYTIIAGNKNLEPSKQASLGLSYHF